MSQKESILLGGGCCPPRTSPLEQLIQKSDNQDIYTFFNKFRFYVQIICTQAVVAADKSESQEIMIAIQWFIFQEENIYKLNKSSQSVAKSYDLIFQGIRELLKSCLIYVRTDPFKCFYILQITASLSKVIFSFHLKNDKRFMECDLQKEILEICDKLRQQMEIEKNDWIQSQLELYLFLTKTSFQMAPTNRSERDKLLYGCLKGIINSLIEMKPNMELLETLFQGLCQLYNMYIENKNRKYYQVYFYIDILQWEIIYSFKNEQLQDLEEILFRIEAIYKKIVSNSNIWKYHYLWIQMIGKILIYNPLIAKQKFYQLTKTHKSGAKSSQIWKEYQNKGFLIQVNKIDDQALIQLNSLKNNQLLQIDRPIFEECFKGWENFLLLKDFLLNEQYQNFPFTFGSYLNRKLDFGRRGQ
ncbi:unnamed protein product [Paramecium pentaurelia]|uniref:Uncharacterized protein n=1 Tax=Paramecium pentaurelia TaxID=43138 RepID=A0A8S1VVX2_9CILI|nr:unnamed protein product [Paramecium pentaurelia]